MPIVSIIMSVYNNRKTLERCLKSLRNQTFQEWEVIIVDDGSTDGSIEVLKQYSLKDKRIRPIRLSKNVGLSAALNIARRYATGDYLARQDGDDFSYPNRLELQLKYLDDHPEIDVVGTYANLVDDEGRPWGLWKPPINPCIKDWVWGPAVIHASVMMRKNALDAVGGYDDKLRRCEDYDLWFKMLACGFRISTIPYALYAVHWTSQDYRRRTLFGRYEEMIVRWKGFRRLNVCPIYWPFVFKPVLLAIIPNKVIYMLHHRRFSYDSRGDLS